MPMFPFFPSLFFVVSRYDLRVCFISVFRTALLTGILLLLFGCDQPSEHIFRGTTMGTTYTVRATHAPASALSGLERAIQDRLERINASMSVYCPESEISRFNALSMGESMPISEDFEHVLRVSTQVYDQTGGAFDPTVQPLLNLWGFGSGAANQETWRPPSEEAVRHALASVGLRLVDASTPGRLSKRHPGVQLDLGGVAKGFAVDALTVLLEERGVRNYLVDIGGDVRVSGRNAEGEPWRIGVNQPERGQDWNEILLVLRPGRGAVLTSGDYRQFFEHDGLFFSHILDPRTGHPLENGVASVTVLAETAVLADALVTGLMVLGVEKGLELVESLHGVEALFLVRVGRDGVEEVLDARSSGFDHAGGL